MAAAVSTPSLPNAATVAAAAALLSRPDGGDIPTSVLAAWAEGGGPVAPLAARALPTRDEEDLRARVKGLLQGTDATIRAHAALGLGRDPEPSAVSLLTNAYAYEEDRSVRRALMRGLSCRHEPQRIATLTLASQLDPDDEVRALARRALMGRCSEPGLAPVAGVEPRRRVVWVVVHENGSVDNARPRALWLVRSDGVAVPMVADPDGVLLVPGVPPGPVRLDFARSQVVDATR